MCIHMHTGTYEVPTTTYAAFGSVPNCQTFPVSMYATLGPMPEAGATMTGVPYYM